MRRFKGITSCNINVNENTSTLVSYSSFLKTSGATYRPEFKKRWLSILYVSIINIREAASTTGFSNSVSNLEDGSCYPFQISNNLKPLVSKYLEKQNHILIKRIMLSVSTNQ